MESFDPTTDVFAPTAQARDRLLAFLREAKDQGHTTIELTLDSVAKVVETTEAAASTVLKLQAEVQLTRGLLRDAVDQRLAIEKRFAACLDMVRLKSLPTRAIVEDTHGPRKLGRNPNWVKAYDVLTALAGPMPEAAHEQ